MNLNLKITFLILSFTVMSFAEATVQNNLGRSPRALLMGDAYTAVADDAYTLFYNPAALGRHKGITFTPINPTIAASNVLQDSDRFKDFPKDEPSAIADRILNYPLGVELSAFPTLKLGNFGLSFFASNRTNLVLRNAIHPNLDIDYRYDRGLIFGYAHSIGSGALAQKIIHSSKTKMTSGKRLSFGASVKYINREGIKDNFDLFGTTILSKIASGNTSVDELKKAFGYADGSAWGADLGMEYVVASRRTQIVTGISVLNIGDTRFNKKSGTSNIPTEEMTINTGIALKQDYGLFDYTLSADIRPINAEIDFARKFHLGSELSFKMFSLNAGWNEGYLSYGASVELWPVTLSVGFYGVEAGSKFNEQKAKRLLVYLSLFDFSFDI